MKQIKTITKTAMLSRILVETVCKTFNTDNPGTAISSAIRAVLSNTDYYKIPMTDYALHQITTIDQRLDKKSYSFRLLPGDAAYIKNHLKHPLYNPYILLLANYLFYVDANHIPTPPAPMTPEKLNTTKTDSSMYLLNILGNKWHDTMQITLKQILNSANKSWNTRIESCAGVLGSFANFPISDNEIINDTDLDKINLFRVIKNHPEELHSKMLGLEPNQETFDAKKKCKKKLNPDTLKNDVKTIDNSMSDGDNSCLNSDTSKSNVEAIDSSMSDGDNSCLNSDTSKSNVETVDNSMSDGDNSCLNLDTPKGNVEAAANFLYLNLLSVRNTGNTFKKLTVKNYAKKLNAIYKLHDRLKNTRICDLDILDIIKNNIKANNTLFVVDPPYLYTNVYKCTHKSKNAQGQFNSKNNFKEHLELSRLLYKVKQNPTNDFIYFCRITITRPQKKNKKPSKSKVNPLEMNRHILGTIDDLYFGKGFYYIDVLFDNDGTIERIITSFPFEGSTPYGRETASDAKGVK